MEDKLNIIYSLYKRKNELFRTPIEVRLQKYSEELIELNLKIITEISFFNKNNLKIKKENIFEKYPNEFISFLEDNNIILKSEKDVSTKVSSLVLSTIKIIEEFNKQEFIKSFNKYLASNEIYWYYFYELIFIIEDFIFKSISSKLSINLNQRNFFALELEIGSLNSLVISKLRNLRKNLLLNVQNEYLFFYSINKKDFRNLKKNQLNESIINKSVNLFNNWGSRNYYMTTQKSSELFNFQYRPENELRYNYMKSKLFIVLTNFDKLKYNLYNQSIESFIKTFCIGDINSISDYMKIENSYIGLSGFIFKYFEKD